MKASKISWPLILILIVLAGCAGGPDIRPYEGTGYMTEDEERRLGYYVDAEVTNQFLTVRNKELIEAVAEIGNRLTAVSHRPNLKYSFKVLNSSMVNAFAGPGGYVYVTTGLLGELESRDELAAVLAHEIGHVTARHSIRALRSANIANTALTIIQIIAALGAAAAGVPATGDLATLTSYLTTLIIFQGYSRAYESQADRLGIQYMMRAGYNPRAMISVFEKFIRMREEEGNKEKLVILSSHPALEDRIKEAKDYIAKLEREGLPPLEQVLDKGEKEDERFR